MVIRVSELEKELSVKGELGKERFESREDDRFSVSSPVDYDLIVVKFDDRVKVRGSVCCNLTLTCASCLEEFDFPVVGKLDIEFVPRDLMPAATEVELKTADLDVDYYEGDEIDLDDVVREEVLLSIPIRPLCSDGCKGLCSICGTNMNYEACQCHRNLQTLLGEKLKSFLERAK